MARVYQSVSEILTAHGYIAVGDGSDKSEFANRLQMMMAEAYHLGRREVQEECGDAYNTGRMQGRTDILNSGKRDTRVEAAPTFHDGPGASYTEVWNGYTHRYSAPDVPSLLLLLDRMCAVNDKQRAEIRKG